MDADRFDRFASNVGRATTRRGALRLLAGGALGAVLSVLGLAGVGANHTGCRHVGKPCARKAQCCSGVCKGPTGAKTCRAHHVGTCQAGQDWCTQGAAASCGPPCLCFVTTGKARFCGRPTLFCATCARDKDCQGVTGTGSACMECAAACAEGTGCVPHCPCAPDGSACTVGPECCGGGCPGGTCCRTAGQPCAAPGQCCSDVCVAGKCVEFVPLP